MADIVEYFTRSEIVHIATELKVVSPEVRRFTMRLRPRG
jgi:hypothetical protein